MHAFALMSEEAFARNGRAERILGRAGAGDVAIAPGGLVVRPQGG
jgi:hypothetical protein